MARKKTKKVARSTRPRIRVREGSALDDILENSLSSYSTRLCRQYVESAKFTTTAIFGISQYLAENGDDEGAELVYELAKEFAKHEAKRL